MNQKNITGRLISIILWLFFSTLLIGDNLTVSGDDRPGILQIGSNEHSVWTVTISGTVKTAAGTPIEGVTMSGLPGNPTTNYLGKYSGSFSCGWSGTVIPSKPGHTFYPTYKNYSRVFSNKYNENYIAAVAVPTYTISGNAGEARATLSYTDGTPKTVTADTAGIYSLTVHSGWCGTVTPAKSCYNFTPPNRVYNNVQANITGEDYTTVPFTYTISGTVKTVGGTPVEGVTMSGLPGNPTTDTYGQYTVAVPCGWCGTVTPSKICYTFTATGRTYTNIQANKPAEDYIAVLINYTISGKVKTTSGAQIAGVVMTGLPGNPVTNRYGQYTVTVPCGWCGTVTPSKPCYNFTPANRIYTNVQANMTCPDYTAATATYTISGTVTTVDGIPLADVIMNGLPGNPKTNSFGQYTGAVSCLWSGTVTPSKTCYTFNPASKNYTNVLADIPTENYIAVSKTYNMAGTIKTQAGTPIPGVVMNGLPGPPITDIYGQYACPLPCGWSGTVTPFNPCYTFTPTNKSYCNIQSNKTCENYTASTINYTISGTVRTADGKALPGVVMNGLPGNPTTNYFGQYCVSIPCGWSGTVTPSKSCYSFNPAAKTYTNLQAKAPDENYIAVPSTYLISGTIKNADGTPIEGVSMSGLPGNPVTNPAGQYTGIVPCGWCGIVMPTGPCYSFSPASRSYSNIQADKSAENYITTPITYTISGTVKTSAGTPIAGLIMNGLPGNPITNSLGQYTGAVPCGWSGTVTLCNRCYTFTPSGRTYTDTRANKCGEDYTAALTNYTISGTIKTADGAPVVGVIMKGLPGNPITDSLGQYNGTVPCGWCGTVAPYKPCYTFTPPSRSYSNFQVSKTGENYVTASLNYSTSGRSVLADLYNSTDGNHWKNNSGWKTPPLHTDGFAMPGTESTWFGITLNDDKEVEQINLTNNNLNGTLPTSIGNLSQLTTLFLEENNISGPIPNSLGNLAKLESLNLGNNNFAGNIPVSLGDLINLKQLYLHNNQLTETIPLSLGNLSGLLQLDLSNNLLSGEITVNLGGLARLKYLNLANNFFNGSIPSWIEFLTPLAYMNLSSNQFSGSIPASIGNLDNLTELYLDNNKLDGSIPAEIGNLQKMKTLSLSCNDLTGNIPTEIGNLSNLNSLHMDNNKFEGSIPASLGNLTRLTGLYLQSNNLEGAIPESLTKLTRLTTTTDLGYNALYTDNRKLFTFLNSKDADWQETQTIASEDVTAISISSTAINVSWKPINYTAGKGGYEVFYCSTHSGCNFTLYGMTENKKITYMTVTGLSPATTYYFIIKSRTDAHSNNANNVVSGNSSEVSAVTVPF